MPRMNLSGDTYANLTVQEFDDEKNKWKCLCSCGNTHYASANSMRTGKTKSCGCLKKTIWARNAHPMSGVVSGHRNDLTGQKYNKLTVLGYAETKKGRGHWLAKCECGNETVVSGKSLIRGNTKSCGCLHRAAAKKRGEQMAGAVNSALREKSLSSIGQKFGKLCVESVSWRDYDNYRIAIAVATCECGTTKEYRLPDLAAGRTVTCGCGTTVSQAEQKLADWISKHVAIEQQFAIDGWHFDISIPSKKVIIEYNGCYWHSSKFINNAKYHVVRRRVAEDAGYRVLTIWSDEYSKEPDAWNARILRAIDAGEPPRTVGARKLNLRMVSRHDAIEHHVAYHAQKGHPCGGIHVGAFEGPNMVAAATIKKGTGRYELTRFTLVAGLSSPGLLSRIMSFVEKSLGSRDWITYCDRDHYTGTMYSKAGFKKTRTTVQMSYLDKGTRVRREHFMKHKLPAIFPGCDTGKTEKEICAENEVFTVHNSGIDCWERPAFN